MKKSQIDLCHDIAKEFHEFTHFQKHVCPVAGMVNDLRIGSEAICVAYLHDILEDTELDRGALEDEGVFTEIIDYVDILTRSKDDDYLDYILMCKEQPITRYVKLCDIQQNLTRFDKPKGTLYHKYRLAEHILKN